MMSKNWKAALVIVIIFAVSAVLMPGFTARAMAEDQQDSKKAAGAPVPEGEAAAAGAAAGTATSSGISLGTIALGALVVGGIGAAALAAGGHGGSTATTAHH